MTIIRKTEKRPVVTSSLTILSLSALGVVFGDIGTSPLYTFKPFLLLLEARLMRKPYLVLYHLLCGRL